MNEIKLDTTQRDVRLDVDGAEVHWLRSRELRDASRRPRIYVRTTDEFNLLEDLANRRRRPYDVWRPWVLDVLKALGYPVCRGPRDACDCGGVRIYWSQRAGCSCGCSPGFIIENGMRHRLYGGDLFIKLTGAPSVDESLPTRDLNGENR